jgi:hypothetical protein
LFERKEKHAYVELPACHKSGIELEVLGRFKEILGDFGRIWEI